MAENNKLNIQFKSATDLRRSVPPSKAKFFYIYLNRKLIFKGEFFRIKDKVDDKLFQINSVLEFIFQPIKAKKKAKKKKLTKKKKAKAKKKAKKKKAVKKKVKKPKKVAKKPPKLPSELDSDYIIANEDYAIDQAYHMESNFHGVVGPVYYIPISTQSDWYEKTLILKNVYSKLQKAEFGLEILDFVLNKKIKVTESNKEKVSELLYQLFRPHIINFFKQRPGLTYLIRITFLRMDPEGEWIDGGFGIERFETRSIKYYLNKFKELFNDDLFLEGPRNKNYLESHFSQELYITGFTAEAIVTELTA